MERNNVPIGGLQRILSHENRTTTEIYLHSIGQSEREAMAVFERARRRSSRLCAANSHTNPHTQEETAKSREIVFGTTA